MYTHSHVLFALALDEVAFACLGWQHISHPVRHNLSPWRWPLQKSEAAATEAHEAMSKRSFGHRESAMSLLSPTTPSTPHLWVCWNPPFLSPFLCHAEVTFTTQRPPVSQPKLESQESSLMPTLWLLPQKPLPNLPSCSPPGQKGTSPAGALCLLGPRATQLIGLSFSLDSNRNAQRNDVILSFLSH